MPGRLEGKVAIVTGGASGFGAAISSHFAKEGAKVLVTDLNRAGGDKVCSEDPDLLQFLYLDVTSRERWTDAVEYAIKKWGRIDILVNNAGWTYQAKPTQDVTESEFATVFDTNVKSIFLGVQAVIPTMQKQKSGSIINIASTGASRPRPGLVWYNSSKGAVKNASKGLAAEYGPDKIRVNTVSPLLTATALFEKFVGVKDTPENREKFIKDVPMGRICEVEDVSKVVVFLASDESTFVTGQNLKVDGGKTI